MPEDVKKKLGARVQLLIAQYLTLVSIGSFFLILLLGYLFLFSPELRRIRAANLTKSLEEERSAKAGYLDSLNELGAKYAILDKEKVAELAVMVPGSEEIPVLLAMFERAAVDSDVSLRSINFSKGELDGAAADIKNLGALNISLSITNASYPRFKLFLERVETNLRLFDIRNIDMNPSGATYNLSIRAYIRKAGKF